MMMTYYCHDMSEKGEEVLADRCGEMLDPGDIALNATMCNPFDACPKGHCEVPANCYWQPLRMAPNGKPMNKEGEIVEDRERWYTDEEGGELPQSSACRIAWGGFCFLFAKTGCYTLENTNTVLTKNPTVYRLRCK